MFRTGVRRNFEAYHALRGDFGAETEPHTHPYVIEWVVHSETLDENGFAADIARMDEVLGEVIGDLEGVFLNDLPYFQLRQTSLENLAVYLHSLLDRAFGHPDESEMEVTIWESETAFASYRA